MPVFLKEECWQLFESIWAMRNIILHNSDGYAPQAAESKLSQRLLKYKLKQDEILQYVDRHPRIDYPVETILLWNRKRKKNFLRILDRLHRIYMLDVRLAAEGQKKINDYNDYFLFPD